MRNFNLCFLTFKDKVDPEEVSQAAKYSAYLEVIFGNQYDVIPCLVLTRATDYYDHVPLGKRDGLLPACSGDMLFNLIDDYMGFLEE